MQLVS